jgi:glucarate dehydratase
MRIVDVTLHRIRIPLELPTIWISGVDTSWCRTVVRIKTDEGLEGIAETSGDNLTYVQLRQLADLLRGHSPFDRRSLLAHLWELPVKAGTLGRHSLQAIETACWDILGKATGRPLHTLLGGALRSQIPAIGYIHPRVDPLTGTVHERRPEDVIAYATALVEQHGFSTLKLKGGVFPPDEEVAVLQALRNSFPGHALRFDPNAAWSVETAERVGHQLEVLNLEWYEDPAWGIEGMCRVRRRVRIPLATNMCCLDLDQLASSLRADAFDVLLLDIDDWGGLELSLKAAATCQAFNTGLGIHSSGEAGISTALHLHIASVLPTLPHAIDSYYHHQTMDVIAGPHTYSNGSLPVPEGAGLGVEIDEDNLARLEELYRADTPAVIDPTGGSRKPGLW